MRNATLEEVQALNDHYAFNEFEEPPVGLTPADAMFTFAMTLCWPEIPVQIKAHFVSPTQLISTERRQFLFSPLTMKVVEPNAPAVRKPKKERKEKEIRVEKVDILSGVSPGFRFSIHGERKRYTLVDFSVDDYGKQIARVVTRYQKIYYVNSIDVTHKKIVVLDDNAYAQLKYPQSPYFVRYRGSPKPGLQTQTRNDLHGLYQAIYFENIAYVSSIDGQGNFYLIMGNGNTVTFDARAGYPDYLSYRDVADNFLFYMASKNCTPLSANEFATPSGGAIQPMRDLIERRHNQLRSKGTK